MGAALEIRVRGRVQGVGFRPNVYRLARELGLAGNVRNDAEGVLICASGSDDAMASFLDRIARESPPLARVEAVETRALSVTLAGDFRIVESSGGAVRTAVTPDAAICAACASEVLDASARRFGYPFTTCTHCGPRLSVIQGIPYDRARTTMRAFPLCPECTAEYEDPSNRRFHAETTACHSCGPKAIFADVHTRLQNGEIVALKGLGGYHLACDATEAAVVTRLRERKKRDLKPFALMARDLDVIRRYCTVSAVEEKLLSSPEAPIVLLRADGPERLPDAIAPGLFTLGFMLPTTPLHLLILQHLDAPLVMTSGNISDSPALVRADSILTKVADHCVDHDREIANRVDDSIARVMDHQPRLLRRARGYAPAPITLPAGFADAPPLLAYGGDLKSTFCLLANGEAILSQHQGDLEDASTFDDYRKNLALYASLFAHTPAARVIDRHPDYASSRLARESTLPRIEVQHHHAHVAACLAENDWPLDGAPVLGIVLDGVGLGDDGTMWGGELLLADYREYRRLGSFKPVALIGGDRAAREPWRNLYAHLRAAEIDDHEVFRKKPRKIIDGMLKSGTQVPLASSCGRLFDAVAAALEIAFEGQAYEGQAGALLESIADERDPLAYPFSIEDGTIVPTVMWRALLDDLARGVAPGDVSMRFHRGLARVVTEMALALRGDFTTVALSGGCFQNRILFEETTRLLRAAGLEILTHSRVPPNDGGLALGQAAIGAARLIQQRKNA